MLLWKEIKRLREAKGIGQIALSELVGCTQQTIAAIETGKVKQR